MDGTVAVSLLVGLLSFILGISNKMNVERIAKEGNFILNVTVERNKWLERIRQDISTFCGHTKFFYYSCLEVDSENGMEVLKEIDKLNFLIRLRLNPNGEVDKKIIELLEKVLKYDKIDGINILDEHLKNLVSLSQELLKEEWEKVKKEAVIGTEYKSIKYYS
ncbi:hypothetical protein [Acetobacterium sp.]|uniref:hypothetical protein n=1 Tax=Acetobacterium sp. TaxID=1872094 RepID=UPI002724A4D9|nr:hypothetical protein [Acetobacterium sp.]MDO9491415.1 hypothetical protein [Acetobacterium sp.]